jgi:hypothetical protein
MLFAVAAAAAASTRLIEASLFVIFHVQKKES